VKFAVAAVTSTAEFFTGVEISDAAV